MANAAFADENSSTTVTCISPSTGASLRYSFATNNGGDFANYTFDLSGASSFASTGSKGLPKGSSLALPLNGLTSPASIVFVGTDNKSGNQVTITVSIDSGTMKKTFHTGEEGNQKTAISFEADLNFTVQKGLNYKPFSVDKMQCQGESEENGMAG